MKSKNKKNNIYYLIIGIYTLGFIFFVISPYIIVDTDEGLLYTEHNTELELTYNNEEIGTFEILEWTYSKKQSLMEVQMYIDLFIEFSDKTELNFTAQQKLDNRQRTIVPITAEQVLEEDGYYIIQISEIEDFLNVTLMIEPLVKNADIKNENSQLDDEIDNKARLRTNYKQVTSVDKIVDKDSSNYAIERIDWGIENKQSKIQEYQNENKEYKNEITKHEEKIEEYRRRTKYLVGDELTDMQEKMSNATGSIATLNANISANKTLIEELEDDIVMLRQKKENLIKFGTADK